MTISPEILRRLAEIEMPAEAMQKVLLLVAEIGDKEEKRLKNQRERKRRSRDGHGTVAGQGRDMSRDTQFPPPDKESSPHTPLKEINPRVVKPSRARKGTSLPSDWEPTASIIAYGEAQGLGRQKVLDELEDFRLWAHANANRPVARKADWHKTAQGWLRRVAKPESTARAPPQTDASRRRAQQDALFDNINKPLDEAIARTKANRGTGEREVVHVGGAANFGGLPEPDGTGSENLRGNPDSLAGGVSGERCGATAASGEWLGSPVPFPANGGGGQGIAGRGGGGTVAGSGTGIPAAGGPATDRRPDGGPSRAGGVQARPGNHRGFGEASPQPAGDNGGPQAETARMNQGRWQDEL